MTTSLNNPVSGDVGESNSAKFPAVGSAITFGLVRFDQYQQKDYDTDELKTFANGDPMMGTKITGIVHSSDNIEIGPKDARSAPEAGSEITVFVEGGKYYAWRDASKAAAKANHNYEVGDLVWFACTSTEPASNPRYNDRKPGAEHGALVDACNAAYRKSETIPVAAPAAAAPAATSTGNPFG